MRVLIFLTATLLVAASLASVNAFSLPNTLKPATTPVTKSSAGDRLVFSGGGARSMIAGLVFNEELASATRFVAPLAQTEGLSGGGWSVLVNEALGPKEALTRLRAWVAKGNEIGGSFKGIPEVLLHSLWHAYGAWIEQQRDTIAAPLSTETSPFAYNEKGQSHVLVGASLSAYQGAATVDTSPQSALLQASKNSGGWDSCILDMRGQSGSLQCGSAPALKVTKNGARVSFAQPYAVSMRGAYRLVEQDDEKEKGAKPKALDDCLSSVKNKERPLVPTKRSDAMKLDRAQQGAFGSLAFLATRLSSSGGCSGLPVEFEVTGTKAVALPVSLELWDLGLRCNIPVTPTDMVTPGVSFAVDASDDKNLFDATRTCVDYWHENFNYQVIDVTESTTTIPWFGLQVNLKSMGALKDYVKVFSFTRAGKSTGRRLVVLTLGNFDPCTGALVDSSKRYNAIHTVTFLKNPNAFDGKRFRLLDVNVRKFLRTALGALFKGAVAVDKLPIDAAECAKYGEDWPAKNDPNSEENKGPVGPRSGSA